MLYMPSVWAKTAVPGALSQTALQALLRLRVYIAYSQGSTSPCADLEYIPDMFCIKVATLVLHKFTCGTVLQTRAAYVCQTCIVSAMLSERLIEGSWQPEIWSLSCHNSMHCYWLAAKLVLVP